MNLHDVEFTITVKTIDIRKNGVPRRAVFWSADVAEMAYNEWREVPPPTPSGDTIPGYSEAELVASMAESAYDFLCIAKAGQL